jgi:hypothetical protein
MAIVDYRLLFADQEKQTSVFRFCLQQTNRSLPVPFTVSRKQMEVAVSVSSIFGIYILLLFQTEIQVIYLNPFIICSLCKRKFVVGPFVDEETKGSYPFSNGLNELSHLCILGMKTWLKINCL